jgi:hypothetical protein
MLALVEYSPYTICHSQSTQDELAAVQSNLDPLLPRASQEGLAQARLQQEVQAKVHSAQVKSTSLLTPLQKSSLHLTPHPPPPPPLLAGAGDGEEHGQGGG